MKQSFTLENLFRTIEENQELKNKATVDVTVESYDGAEPCELISIFLLISIGSRYNPNIISRLYNNFLKIQVAHSLKKSK